MLAFVVSLMMVSFDPSVLTIPPDPKEAWIKSLHSCENVNNIEKVLDTNGKYSYGKYQWQMDSWLEFKKQGATKENIDDSEMQDRITRYALDKGQWRRWFNCAKKIPFSYGSTPPTVSSYSQSNRRDER